MSHPPTWQIPRNHSTSMTDASAYTDPAADSGDASETWTTWGLISKHKIAAGVGVVLLLLLLVIIVGGLVSAKPVVVSDATTCTSWGATNQTQQRAYALLYVREHGPVPSGARDPAAVIAAINNGCSEAYVNDVEDNVTVVQALQPQ
jgi:hypothetical protein